MKRALAAGVLALGAWPFIEARLFRANQHTLAVLPPGVPALRVLNVSDLHLLPSDRQKRAFISHLADLKPDLLFLTGDQLSSTEALPALLDALEPLRGVPGAFVFGSHDYYAPVWKNPLSYLIPALAGEKEEPPKLPAEEMAAEFEKRGWIDLRNRTAHISLGDLTIGLVGVDDPHIDLDEYPGPVEADFRIGLTHAPYSAILDQFADDKVDLALAGHTHGGQVCVPFYGALVTNCDLPTHQVSGIIDWKTMPVAISRGLGTSPFTPFRLACPPEIQVLDLASVT